MLAACSNERRSCLATQSNQLPKLSDALRYDEIGGHLTSSRRTWATIRSACMVERPTSRSPERRGQGRWVTNFAPLLQGFRPTAGQEGEVKRLLSVTSITQTETSLQGYPNQMPRCGQLKSSWAAVLVEQCAGISHQRAACHETGLLTSHGS